MASPKRNRQRAAARHNRQRPAQRPAPRPAQEAKLADERRLTRRRRRFGIVVGALAAIFIVAFVLSQIDMENGGSSAIQTAATPSSTTVPKTTTTATTPPGSTTPPSTAPKASTTSKASKASKAPSRPPSAYSKFPTGALAMHAAPAVSASCNVHRASSTNTKTLPASGNQVSIVPAPTHVGFPSLRGSSPRYTYFGSQAPPFCINVNKTYTATVKTDVGSFTISLLAKAAPRAVNSFVFLAGYHYFNGIVFQRVIPGFIDQGGDPLGTGKGGPGYRFRDELPKSSSAYMDGAVGMANSGPNSNGSQFFVDATNLAGKVKPSYSVFGLVTKGMSVVEAINRGGSQSGTPTDTHRILSVTVSDS